MLWKKAISHYICFWPRFPLLGSFYISQCLHHFLRFIFFLCLAVLIWDSNHSKVFIQSCVSVCVCNLFSALWNPQRQQVSLTRLVSRHSLRLEAGLKELEAVGHIILIIYYYYYYYYSYKTKWEVSFGNLTVKVRVP